MGYHPHGSFVMTKTVYMVRGSQGEKGPFQLGQGMSRKLAMVRGKILFSTIGKGKDVFFIIMKLLNFFRRFANFSFL